jgi:aspartate aminotransferase
MLVDLHQVSKRARALHHDVGPLVGFREFYLNSPYAVRRFEPDIIDFTLGNPHDMPMPEYVDALRSVVEPRNKDWFAYKTYELPAQEAAAASLERHLGLSFAPEDILLTTGGFSAIAVSLKTVADPGDEVIYSLPPWWLYEGLIVEAGLVPRKVMIDLNTFDLDVDAIAAAITERTRVVIVNTPNNPTGRIYPPETLRRLATVLEEASVRNGRRIYIVSDEPYNRLIFDGAQFHSPVEFYPYSFLAYSYGKTHLAPGQRLGYIALPPTMPDRDQIRQAVFDLQLLVGFAFPNAVMQYALPRLEQFSIDVARLQRRRDHLVDALTGMGYRVNRPEATFYLFANSPIPDDGAFAERLTEEGIFLLPGKMFETPGFFRISLTANDDMIERSLPGFEKAIAWARSHADQFEAAPI